MAQVTFYVCSHQDDWQLFRGEVAYTDIRDGISPGDKVVFLYVTAGDAGGTFGPGWWGARELGALESCRYVTGPKPFLWSVRTFSTARASFRPITYCQCGNTTSYFMRLPDGQLNGLRLGGAPLTTIDNSTTYSDWTDLCDTIQKIIQLEKSLSTSTRPWVNTSDYDESLNQHSNSDHISVGHAVDNATATGYNRVWWLDYVVEDLPTNLDTVAIQRKTGLQRAYTDRILSVTTDAGNPIDDWANAGSIYETWITRSYARSDAGG